MTGAAPSVRRLAAAAGGLGSAFAAAPAFAQKLGQAAAAGPSAWRVAAVLILCLLLAIAAALLLKARLRGGGSAPSGWRLPLKEGAGALFGAAPPRRLRLVETLRLSHQVDICLFTCDQREFVVAATPHGATVLTGEAALAAGVDRAA